jgi:hypothetical protein
MAIYDGNQGYGAPTPALRASRPATPRYSQLTHALSGARSAFSNPYDGTNTGGQLAANDQAHYGRLPTPTFPTYTPPAPLGTPSSYTQQQPTVPQAPAGMSFDLSTDPVLQQMQAMAQNQRAQAESGALKLRKQLAVDYGDSAYGNTIDSATGQAAEQNPFSILANLRTQYGRNQGNLEEDLNSHNLFYGGARIKALSDALHDYQGQQAGAAGAEQNALGGIDQNRIAALMQADRDEQSAYTDAYNRQLQLALAGGYPAPAGAPPPGSTDTTDARPRVPPAGPNIQLTNAYQRAIAGLRTGLS